MSLALLFQPFTAQHVSNVSTSIFRSLRLTVDLFHVLYFSGSMCVGVTVWFGWGCVVSLCRLNHSIISLFTAQHVSNVSTSIFRSLRLIVDLFHVLYCSDSMYVGVTVWFGQGGVVSLCRLNHSIILLFNAQHVSNVSTSIFRSLRLIC